MWHLIPVKSTSKAAEKIKGLFEISVGGGCNSLLSFTLFLSVYRPPTVLRRTTCSLASVPHVPIALVSPRQLFLLLINSTKRHILSECVTIN